ncbi:Major surface-labeled trophozoite antigen 417 [Symbiodinium microadriaticum]|uniref:Major surface-labeled trophozoite antigen 417 n=1 Tax=Symbiodinium microadriaticum TaxID=2951 RepID=A0A1Q9D293_SYMMI|nr:Major surface-labeled trophozoite antigen 417 [Symbiodinium microadriaticum]
MQRWSALTSAITAAGRQLRWQDAVAIIARIRESQPESPNMRSGAGEFYEAKQAAAAAGREELSGSSPLESKRQLNRQRKTSGFGAAALALQRQPGLQAQLLQLMAEERISPDMTVCSTVATSWERASSWEAALDLLASIELRDLDTVAAGTLASALAKGASWSQALVLVDATNANVLVMGAVVSACERAHRWTAALELMERMFQQGPWPDTVVLDSVLRACGRGLAWEAVLSLFASMPSQFLCPGATGFSAVSLALGCGRQWIKMLDMLEVMSQQRMTADVPSLSMGLEEAEQRSLQVVETKLLRSLAYSVPGLRRLTRASAGCALLRRHFASVNPRHFFGCSEEELAARDAAMASGRASYERAREKEMSLGPPLGAGQVREKADMKLRMYGTHRELRVVKRVPAELVSTCNGFATLSHSACLNLLPLLPCAACGSMQCKHGLRGLGSAGALPEWLGLASYNVDVYVAQMPSCAASSLVPPGQAASFTPLHGMLVSTIWIAKAASEQWDFNSSCCSARQLAAIPAGHIVGGARSDLLDSAAGAVTAMSYSSQWDLLFVGGDIGTLQAFRGSDLAIALGGNVGSRVTSVTYDHANGEVVAGGLNGRVVFMQVSTLQSVANVDENPGGSQVNSVAFVAYSDDVSSYSEVASCSYFNSNIRLWSMSAKAVTRELLGHSNVVLALKPLDGLQMLSSGSIDGFLGLWSLPLARLQADGRICSGSTFVPLPTSYLLEDCISAALQQASPGGGDFFVYGQVGGTSANECQLLQNVGACDTLLVAPYTMYRFELPLKHLFKAHDGAIRAIESLPDQGGLVASAGDDGAIHAWSPDTGFKVRDFGSGSGQSALNHGINSIAYSITLDALVAATLHQLAFFDASTGQLLTVISRSTTSPALSLSMDTWGLVLSSRGTEIEVWSVEVVARALERRVNFAVPAKQDQPGQVNCKQCPRGSAQPNSGQTNCIACEDNSAAPSVGSELCQECPDGTEPSTDHSDCLTCSQGTAGQNGVCNQCQDGEQNSPDFTLCAPCPTGMFGTNGFCSPCPDGAQPDSTRSACVPCSGGFAGTAGVCNRCPPGEEPDAAAAICIACSTGRAGSNGSCANCPLGMVASVNRSVCEFCSDGQAAVNGVCQVCPDGSLVAENRSACLDCPDGYAGTGGLCDLCPEELPSWHGWDWWQLQRVRVSFDAGRKWDFMHGAVGASASSVWSFALQRAQLQVSALATLSAAGKPRPLLAIALLVSPSMDPTIKRPRGKDWRENVDMSFVGAAAALICLYLHSMGLPWILGAGVVIIAPSAALSILLFAGMHRSACRAVNGIEPMSRSRARAYAKFTGEVHMKVDFASVVQAVTSSRFVLKVVAMLPVPDLIRYPVMLTVRLLWSLQAFVLTCYVVLASDLPARLVAAKQCEVLLDVVLRAAGGWPARLLPFVATLLSEERVEEHLSPAVYLICAVLRALGLWEKEEDEICSQPAQSQQSRSQAGVLFPLETDHGKIAADTGPLCVWQEPKSKKPWKRFQSKKSWQRVASLTALIPFTLLTGGEPAGELLSPELVLGVFVRPVCDLCKDVGRFSAAETRDVMRELGKTGALIDMWEDIAELGGRQVDVMQLAVLPRPLYNAVPKSRPALFVKKPASYALRVFCKVCAFTVLGLWKEAWEQTFLLCEFGGVAASSSNRLVEVIWIRLWLPGCSVLSLPARYCNWPPLRNMDSSLALGLGTHRDITKHRIQDYVNNGLSYKEAEVALRKYLTAGEKNLKFRVRFLARARRLQKMLSALDALLSVVMTFCMLALVSPVTMGDGVTWAAPLFFLLLFTLAAVHAALDRLLIPWLSPVKITMLSVLRETPDEISVMESVLEAYRSFPQEEVESSEDGEESSDYSSANESFLDEDPSSQNLPEVLGSKKVKILVSGDHLLRYQREEPLKYGRLLRIPGKTFVSRRARESRTVSFSPTLESDWSHKESLFRLRRSHSLGTGVAFENKPEEREPRDHWDLHSDIFDEHSRSGIPWMPKVSERMPERGLVDQFEMVGTFKPHIQSRSIKEAVAGAETVSGLKTHGSSQLMKLWRLYEQVAVMPGRNLRSAPAKLAGTCPKIMASLSGQHAWNELMDLVERRWGGPQAFMEKNAELFRSPKAGDRRDAAFDALVEQTGGRIPVSQLLNVVADAGGVTAASKH